MKDIYCSYCSAAFVKDKEHYPKRCAFCNNVTWRNPLPVSVVLVPIENGLIVGRRGIDPGKTEFGLPGGYIEYSESWRNAGARELREELGLEINPNDLELFDVFSSDEHILVFSKAPIQSRKAVDNFILNEETTEILLATKPMQLAFESHTKMMEKFFK